MANFQDYLNVLKSGIIKPRIKIEWLRKDETVESIMVEDVLDGSLSINRNNGIRRTIDFTIKNSPALLPNIFGIWINKKLRLSLGVTCADGTDFFIPQGVFILLNPSYLSNPNGDSTVTFNAVDKFANLLGESGSGLLTDIYQIPASTPVNTGIKTILTTFNDPIAPNLYPNNITYPYAIIKGYGENVGSIIQETASMMSYNVFYDNLGALNLVPDIDDATKASLYDFNSSDDKFCYLGGTVESDFVNVRNVVKVIGANVNNSTIIIGVAKDTDLTSPSNIYTNGEIPYPPIENNYITTQLQADNLASYILKRVKILNESISMSSIPMYHLSVDEVITITDNSLGLDRSRYLINSITIPLGLFGEMSISCIKTAEVDFTVGKVG